MGGRCGPQDFLAPVRAVGFAVGDQRLSRALAIQGVQERPAEVRGGKSACHAVMVVMHFSVAAADDQTFPYVRQLASSWDS